MRDAILNNDNANNYTLAWGLRNLFSMWDKWLNELGGYNARVKRQLRIFNTNEGNVTRDNISQLFFSDNPNGIAKTETVKEGGIFGFGGHEVIKAKSPLIEDAMLKAYRELHINTATTSRDQALSTLLLVISKALDNVIDNNCDL